MADNVDKVIVSTGALMLVVGTMIQANLELAEVRGFQRSIRELCDTGEAESATRGPINLRRQLKAAHRVSSLHGGGYRHPEELFWIPPETLAEFSSFSTRITAWYFMTFGAVLIFIESTFWLGEATSDTSSGWLVAAVCVGGIAVSSAIARRLLSAPLARGRARHEALFRAEFGNTASS